MIERSGNDAVLVALDFGEPGFLESLGELKELASSARVGVLGVVTGKRASPDSATYVGAGKLDEVAVMLVGTGANLAIFNHELTAAQQRNLENRLKCRVIDRTSLILDIFSQRAKSFEGKLQVELAQLEHLSTRLIRGWTHLERQKGGIGLRGPGETQLETDRRLIGKRVKLLKERLKKLRQQREVQRRSRSRGHVTSVSLVGYTNAGKSTLFNALTRANAYAADQLFATLDTTSRRMFVRDCGQIVLSDTVGFIRQLPHTLVASFCATLEETIHADLLLHVVDSSNPVRDEQIAEVNRVLAEIGADTVPQILIFNKIDINGQSAGMDRDEYGKISKIRLSAGTGEGLDLVRQCLGEFLCQPSALDSELAAASF